MALELDAAYEIKSLFDDLDNCSGSYMSVSYHRNGDPEKSQWTISVEEEFRSFAISRQNRWYQDKRGWGIHPSGSLIEVGTLVCGKIVRISRFQEMSPLGQEFKDIWHGYPADIKGKTNDIPVVEVLDSWLNAGIIKRHQLSKIRRGLL